MFDPRLLGTWRSDARKTTLDIAARRDLKSAKDKRKYKKLSSLFGKLELRYTRTHCHSRLGAHESVQAYKVVAKDEYSVALLSSQPLVGSKSPTYILKANITGFTLVRAACENFSNTSQTNHAALQQERLTPDKSRCQTSALDGGARPTFPAPRAEW
jgi:hypothetical protein